MSNTCAPSTLRYGAKARGAKETTVTRIDTAKREKYLSLSEAADQYGVCVKTLRRRISEGLLPAVRMRGGRAIRVSESAAAELFKPIPTVRNW